MARIASAVVIAPTAAYTRRSSAWNASGFCRRATIVATFGSS